jgi:hypothetical protein
VNPIKKNVANLADQLKGLESKALTMSFLVRQLADQPNMNLADQGVVSNSICKEHF